MQANQRIKKEIHSAIMKIFGRSVRMPWEPSPISEELRRRTFAPIGKPVSQAFTVQDGEVGEPMRHTLAVIDKLHGDGNIPLLRVERQLIDRLNGKFVAGRGIFINIESQIPEFTTAHEVGHVIDFYGFTSGRNESLVGHEMMPVLDAWLASTAYRALQALRARLSPVLPDPGKERNRQIALAQVNYLMDFKEVWSRAYAQWLATSSQDSILLRQLETLQQEPDYSDLFVQWGMEDFAHIAREIDLLFKRKGWFG